MFHSTTTSHTQLPTPQALRLLGLALLTIATFGTLHSILNAASRHVPVLHPAEAFGFVLFALSVLLRGWKALKLLWWSMLGGCVAVLAGLRLIEGLLPGGPYLGEAVALWPGRMPGPVSFDLSTTYALMTLHLCLALQPFHRGAAMTVLAAAWAGIWWSTMTDLFEATIWGRPVSAFSLSCMVLAGLAMTHILRSERLLRPLFSHEGHGRRMRMLLALALIGPWFVGIATLHLAPQAASARLLLPPLLGLFGATQLALVLTVGVLLERTARADARAELFDPVAGRACRFRPDRDLIDGKGPVGVILCAPRPGGRGADPEADEREMQSALRRAVRNLRAEDNIGRWRRDMLMVVAHVPSESDLARIGERLEQVLRPEPDRPVAAIGISMSAFGEANLEAALRRAENALYVAERRGGGSIVRGSELAETGQGALQDR
ncbi:diguanylate cyclase [Rhodovulum sp. MB263]|uniref:diguanylate cyclase n=1 Tax=Rhodovulum sp. (strain MB263) TaxID=308754 RepID=UPI0009B7428E|nr:diguanylate cyclase [Rhodovulum sp. MB263]ARC88796.1 hypothetical protein B5V46_09280 [Rhodovulum sp. MB263]